MDFEAIQVIWDSQNERPLYAMDEAALHAAVRRKSAEFDRQISRCYVAEISVGLFCGVLMFAAAGALATGNREWLARLPWIRAAVSFQDVLTLFAAGVVWLYYSIFMYFKRRRQQKRAAVFPSSLRGDLDRALAQTNSEVDTAENILWWGLIPIWLAAALWVLTLFRLQAAPAWAYAVIGIIMVIALMLVLSSKHRSIQNRFQPRIRELQSMRAKLDEPERHNS
jgi:hypothetical protein